MFFIECPESANFCKTVKNRVVVSLKPEVSVLLKKTSLDYENTSGHFSNASHAVACKKSSEISCWMRDQFHFKDVFGVESSYSEILVWYTRFVVHYCLWSIEIMQSAAEKHKPSEIVSFYYPYEDPNSALIDPAESVFPILAESFCRVRGINYRCVRFGRISAMSKLLGAWFKRRVNAVAVAALACFDHLALFRWGVRTNRRSPIYFTTLGSQFDQLSSTVEKSCGSHPRVLLRDHGDAKDVVRFLKGKSPAAFDAELWLEFLDVFSLEDSKSIKRLAAELGRVAGLIASREDIFSHLGVSFHGIVSKKIRTGITRKIFWLHGRVNTLARLFKSNPPASVFSAGGTEEDMAMGELCSLMSISAILISHGSYAVPQDPIAAMEWEEHSRRLIRAPFPFVAAQSPMAQEYLSIFPPKGKIVKTGPLAWGSAMNPDKSVSLRKSILDRTGCGSIVVHAGTPKSNSTIRFHTYETPDEYIQSLVDLSQSVEKLPGVCLVVRFRPHPELSIDTLIGLVPFSSKILLSTDGPFGDMLGAADLLVSFSSTTIEEALINNVPVLLYGAQGRYRHLPPSPGVHCASGANQLTETISRILNHRRPEGSVFDPYRFSQSEKVPISFLWSQK